MNSISDLNDRLTSVNNDNQELNRQIGDLKHEIGEKVKDFEEEIAHLHSDTQ